MPKPLPRLGHSDVTRARIAAALKGHSVSAETRARISASMKGRAKPEEVKEKMRGPRMKRTNENVIAECKKIAKKKILDLDRLRLKRWRMDMLAAHRLGDAVLYADVKSSCGKASRRKVFDPTGKVSCGVTRVDGVRWEPFSPSEMHKRIWRVRKGLEPGWLPPNLTSS